MMDGTNRIELRDVEVVEGGDGLFILCRVGDKVVRIPSLRRLPGTTISWPGDRGVLVLEREFAVVLGLGLGQGGRAVGSSSSSGSASTRAKSMASHPFRGSNHMGRAGIEPPTR